MMMKRTRTRLATARPNKQPSSQKSNTSETMEFRTKNVNIQSSYEKYMNLAQEALTTGDRVLAEGFFQKADHYLRLINETKQSLPTIAPSETHSFSEEFIMEDNDFENSIMEELELAQFGNSSKTKSDQDSIAVG